MKKLLNILLLLLFVVFGAMSRDILPEDKVYYSKGIDSVFYHYYADRPNDLYIAPYPNVELYTQQHFVVIDSVEWDFLGTLLHCGVKGIDDQTFRGNKYLEEITFNDIIIRIGMLSFGHCKLMTKIELPNSLREIDESAFYGCLNLTEITFPDSLTYLGELPFENTGFSNDSANWEGWGLYGAEKYLLQTRGTLPDSIILKDGIRLMCRRQFYKHSELKYVECPEGMVSIPEQSFAGCTGLKKVVIPSTVTEVGTYSFANCPELDTIECRALIPPAWTEREIDGWEKVYGTDFYGNITVVVPSQSVGFYQINSNWKKFNIVGSTTDVEDISTNRQPASKKTVDNGNIYILHNGRKYNLLGAEVK